MTHTCITKEVKCHTLEMYEDTVEETLEGEEDAVHIQRNDESGIVLINWKDMNYGAEHAQGKDVQWTCLELTPF